MKRFDSMGPILMVAVVALCGGPVAQSAAQDIVIDIRQPVIRLPGPPPENACGNVSVYPTIFDADPVSPPALNPDGKTPANWNRHNGRLSRNGIHYVSANFVRVRVVTDRCTHIYGALLGSRTLPTSYDQGYWYSVLPSYQPPSDPGQLAHDVTIFHPALRDGSTDNVTIRVGRDGHRFPYLRITDHKFPLVHVKAVDGSEAGTSIGLSRTEILNMFGRALYSKFNGAVNSTVLTSSDGSQRRVYGYDPNTLNVTISSNGIAFQFKFKADVDDWCDPTVRAYGTFKLHTDKQDGISVEWVNDAQGSLTWPDLCAAIQTIPLLGLAPTMAYEILDVNGQASSGIQGAIETAVMESLQDTGDAKFLLGGSRTRTNELLIDFDFGTNGAPSVTIQVPYDAFDMTRNATAFTPGDVLTLFASGLGMNDYVANVSPTTTLWSGPNGVPLAGTTTWPNPQAVARTGSLAWNGQPVARLLARTAPEDPLREAIHRYSPGCNVVAEAGFPFNNSAWIRFGVNDTAADAQRLRGYPAAPGYEVRVTFANTLLSYAKPCFSPAPVVQDVVY